MTLIVITLLAISLSMDAFSLALAYGTLNLDNRKEIITSIMVGIFHFFMPLLGYKVGKIILKIINIDPIIIAGIIFIILGIEMLLSLLKEEKATLITNLFSIMLFSLTVSIDSFSIGIGLNAISNNIFLCSIIFSIVSFLFTLFGLKLGKNLSTKFGNITVLIGAIILIMFGINYLS